MNQFQVTNIKDFQLQEQMHILILKTRAEKIQSYKAGGASIDIRLQKELDALEWVFEVLNEISEED